MEGSPLTSLHGDSREADLLTVAVTCADAPASTSEVAGAGMAFNFNRQLWLAQTCHSMSRDCCFTRELGVRACLWRSAY